ncbi:hypothetical protein Bacsa_3464 [Phocaeicola salanitronis DSM 18170]|uniref:exo-alpha-sialidase n=1 Tax=Phocaeicola salanitronis (strain DSM 18170 / JCM 13657 / CCUG 60908 / BL78) TaxID=667015 RepID=F0R6T4_PHOSB|nr:sialidase family protein [Phocaeicola salanitronis]ADY37989.1 hypothetical protein Bacsa_3464 [Phocaeicola salanitronis DSM 18170]
MSENKTISYWLILALPWIIAPFIHGQKTISDKTVSISQLYSRKIVAESEYVIPGHILVTDGKLYSNPPNYLSTDFISVADCDIIKCYLPPSKGGGVAFYDEGKRFISGINTEQGGVIKVKIPDATSFVRLSKRTDLAGLRYGARLYSSINRTKHALLVESHEITQRLNANLFSELTPNFFPVFVPSDSVCSKMGIKGINATGKNRNESQPFFRIPIHLKTRHGTILVACNSILEQNGVRNYSVVIARSENGGQTFNKRLICKGTNLSMIYDKQYDRIFFLHGLNYSVSTDDWQTWSDFKPMNIKKPQGWEKFYASPTVGIQLENGILAAPYILMNGLGKDISKNANAVVYSADFGKTWKVTAVTPDTIIANETTIAEYAPNQIMINARGGTEVQWGSPNPGRRVFVPVTPLQSERKDWHINEWKLHESDKQLIEPICNASFIACQYDKYRFGLFCNPHTTGKERKNLMLQVSSDFTHWTKVGLLTPFNRVVYGYCSLNYQNGQLSFVYEDKECGIIYADLTPFMDEILTKMIANKMLYKQD